MSAGNGCCPTPHSRARLYMSKEDFSGLGCTLLPSVSDGQRRASSSVMDSNAWVPIWPFLFTSCATVGHLLTLSVSLFVQWGW